MPQLPRLRADCEALAADALRHCTGRELEPSQVLTGMSEQAASRDVQLAQSPSPAGEVCAIRLVCQNPLWPSLLECFCNGRSSLDGRFDWADKSKGRTKVALSLWIICRQQMAKKKGQKCNKHSEKVPGSIPGPGGWMVFILWSHVLISFHWV